MTPKERAVAALECRVPDMVPTMEIDFELNEALTGKRLILGQELAALQGAERKCALNHNIDVYLETALALDYSAITIHPAPTPMYTPDFRYYPTLEEECYVIQNLCAQAGNQFFVAAGIDGTYAIPNSKDFLSFSYAMYDTPELLLEEAERRTSFAVDQMKRLIDAGAEIMYCCSDYCFNQGPFLSPAQFEQFIYPFLRRQTQELREAGAYVVKHTDGNILPILEMMLDCKPHAIHSIDPIAGMQLRDVKSIIAGRAAVIGNVDTRALQAGDTAGIIKSAERALKQGMPGGGYIYATCNSVFEGIALEDYQLMLDVRRRLGHYESASCADA